MSKVKTGIVESTEVVTLSASHGGGRALERAVSAALLVVLIVIWHFVASSGKVSALLLPAPLAVAQRLATDFSSQLFWSNLLSTISAMLSGFGIGTAIGILLGGLLATRPRLERILHPYFVGFQTFPKIAIAPLLAVWLGYEQQPKIVLAALLAFFPVMVNALVGFRATRADELELFNALQASGWQTFWKVRVPNAAGYIFAGVELALVLGLLGTITAEVLGSKQGLGYLLVVRMSLLEIDGVFALLVIFAALGTTTYALSSALHRKVVFWS
jgi:NitT/TauT family transport system permease protein